MPPNKTTSCRVTELPSVHRHIEQMDTAEILACIHEEDAKITAAVTEALPAVAGLINAAVALMKEGGRLFYMGAGTSGRLGVLDASECPPTFGVPADQIQAVLAGGDKALRLGLEDAEDDETAGWKDLIDRKVTERDFVIGIAASGSTPYVVGALSRCREKGILTGCIVSNPDTPLEAQADYPVRVITGPEFITGSTRMKAGTAQKMILNMISTAIMVRLGRVMDNRMVYMQINNDKLLERATRLVMEAAGISDYTKAQALLKRHGTVQRALQNK